MRRGLRSLACAAFRGICRGPRAWFPLGAGKKGNRFLTGRCTTAKGANLQGAAGPYHPKG